MDDATDDICADRSIESAKHRSLQAIDRSGQLKIKQTLSIDIINMIKNSRLFKARHRCADNHGPNIYKDTKPYLSSLLVLNRVYRLEIQAVMLVFWTPLLN